MQQRAKELAKQRQEAMRQGRRITGYGSSGYGSSSSSSMSSSMPIITPEKTAEPSKPTRFLLLSEHIHLVL